MKFTTIRIEGAILSADILDKIEQGELGGQLAKDFGFETNIKVKDEIVRAWADAQDFWRIFKRHRESVSQNATGTSETRKYWITPFLTLLGYDVETSKAEIVNGKTYAISHRAKNLDNFPIHIMGFNDSLDKKREDSGPRMSPHALVQEYVNLTEHLYAIVTNGIYLRFLRDSSRLIKLSFIEFDLEAMMEEEHYADFAIMYRLLHSSRMPVKTEAGPESFIEKYHQDALDSGSRIRDGLRAAVKFSIESLANGFLKHPANEALREDFQQKTLSAYDYYQLLLRLIYRLLFLMVIEERDLIYPRNADKTKRDIYYNYYSMHHLRRLSEKGYLEEERYNDLWISLKNTSRLFESESKGKHLDINPLAGDLFGYDAIGILNNCYLDNKTILECLKNLSVFINQDTGQKMRVNYASLNTEEFGSVYEGLLEYAPEIINEDGSYRFIFMHGTERSSTGTHYTPDELVQPLIKHSLDYIIDDKLKGPDPEKALLSIRVCDVAAGSGHILLNAARRIGAELAKVRTGEDQPSPRAYRAGVRDAIRNCIYGVDKNPLAVELCKVSLWLEAHIPGEPLNFLDHHIKCGDSIVGLAYKEELLNGIATEAFKRLPGDDPDFAKRLAKRNRGELEYKKQLTIAFEQTLTDNVRNIAALLNKLNTLPETTPAEVAAKQKEYQKLTGGSLWWRLKNLADIQTAQFFIPKTKENEKKLITDAEYREYLNGRQMVGMGIAKATAAALDKRVFHWFLEFPEIFAPSPVGGGRGEGKSGFDCILANPPFLGGQKLTSTFGQSFLEYVKYAYAPAGSCDLVTYFFRRIFTIIKPGGFQALISTNTIAQGSAREGGLEVILSQGGIINFAVRSMKWPGLAAVEVALVNVYKGKWKQQFVLGNKVVKQITAYLDDAETTENPYPLLQNGDKSFQGSIVLGTGFIVEPHEAAKLIERNPKNKDVLFPYLNGEDLNTSPDQSPSRWVINFYDLPLTLMKKEEWASYDEETQKAILKEGVYASPIYTGKVATDYPNCLDFVERLVKPERLQQTGDRGAKYWWQFLRIRGELYRTIASLNQVLVVARVGKYQAFVFSQCDKVFHEKIVVTAFSEYKFASILNSEFHQCWARRYSSTLGGMSTVNYSPSDCFDTFPFPQDSPADADLDQIGAKYHERRKQLMLKMQLGLTKTYNQFHNQQLSAINGELPEKETEKKYGKETLNLWNHLRRTENRCSFNEAVEGIFELRRLHREMDETVLKAYGWTDINLAHDFYEVDYLPENDRIRYTISPDVRREIMKRLLKLNHEIHEREVSRVKQTTATKKSSKAKKSKTNSKQIPLL
jgi:type I restriction-modification system DNA methylase subunit